MKIRNGFVSNSSSSSFIVANGDVATIANIMLNVVLNDWYDLDDKTVEAWRKNATKCHNNEDIRSGKIGITIPSCNYETYIFKSGQDVYIDTCHNHEWPMEEMGVIRYHGGGEDEGDSIHKESKKKRYFNVKNCLVHSRNKWNWKDKQGLDKNKCPVCSADPLGRNLLAEYVVYKKKRVCAHCYRGVLGTQETILWPEEEKTAKEDKKKNKHRSLLAQKQKTVSSPLYHLEV